MLHAIIGLQCALVFRRSARRATAAPSAEASAPARAQVVPARRPAPEPPAATRDAQRYRMPFFYEMQRITLVNLLLNLQCFREVVSYHQFLPLMPLVISMFQCQDS